MRRFEDYTMGLLRRPLSRRGFLAALVSAVAAAADPVALG